MQITSKGSGEVESYAIYTANDTLHHWLYTFKWKFKMFIVSVKKVIRGKTFHACANNLWGKIHN